MESGSLGAALLQDSGLSQYGLKVVAGFDVRSDIIGKEVNGIPVFHISELSRKQKEYGAQIGILTVPVG